MEACSLLTMILDDDLNIFKQTCKTINRALSKSPSGEFSFSLFTGVFTRTKDVNEPEIIYFALSRAVLTLFTEKQ